MTTDSRQALAALARSVGRRFDLEFVAIAVPARPRLGRPSGGRERQSSSIVAELSECVRGRADDTRIRRACPHYAGHRTMTVEGRTVRLVPLRVGAKPVGLIAAAGRPDRGRNARYPGGGRRHRHRTGRTPRGAQGRRAHAAERAAENHAAGIAQPRPPHAADRHPHRGGQSQYPDLTREDRLEQSDLILSEVERLTRLFQNVLEMARIDAGAVATESRWAHPSEIVAAARDQVEHTLQEPPRESRDRARRPGAAGSAPDRNRAGPPARKRRAVPSGIDDRGRPRA